MMASMFKGAYVMYTIHFPGKVVSTNADDENVDLTTRQLSRFGQVALVAKRLAATGLF